MLSSPVLVMRRARAQRLVLTAALATILLATVLLCGLTLYGDSAADSGLRTALASAPSAATVTQVSGPTSAQRFAAQDRTVGDAARRDLWMLPVATHVSARSASYAISGRTTRGQPDLATFHFFTGLETHARLTSGRWPAQSQTGRVSTAVVEPAATALGLHPGSILRLTNRLTHAPVEVVVSGVFRPADPRDELWRADPYGGTGVQRRSYVSYGPFVVPQGTFLARFAGDAEASWILVPDFSRLHARKLPALRDGNRHLADAVRRSAAFHGSVQVGTDLPDRLDALDRALVATRSILLVPMLQLALLAAYALLLTARLLDEHRRGEHALLRSRGASSGQLSGLAVREALLLTLPAAAVAPVLASVLLRAVSASGVFIAAGMRLDGRVAAGTWAEAGAVALACGLVLTLPVARRGESFVASQAARGRPSRRSVVQRAGADVALLGVAVLGYWELRHYDSPVLRAAGTGALRVDPLLVAAPTLALLAGGLLALRLLPLLSHAAERAAARSRRLAAPLGTWQVSRRPLRQSGPTLLLALALAIGTLSAMYSASWGESQDDQADYRAGADLRLTAPYDTASPPPLARHAAYAALPGVRVASPVARTTVTVGNRAGETLMLGLDARRTTETVRLRPDLASEPLPRLLHPLAAARPAAGGVPLPGRP
jgi:hypothetical protein